ncbi:DNA primase [Oceanicella actignis]|uniref:DNA primase n=1 Tax=Oceanicella actignis TaxID=1189325 RepID=A0A1M7TYH9_9RHOB|nr:DNA primase [Oceanicella actignis]SET81737.1 DNA primase [Oceanicella actignis]SHN75735.1 DNA primase [Oceanicella actignis]
MSLPPGFLDELRTRVSLSDVVGRKVAWDRRKSNPARGDWWAPCPFHQERTASFHVDDRKGFYYCFGCQAKGDAIGFVMESENLSFIEAVELLAAEAGMTMPTRDPEAARREDRRKTLVEVMELSARFMRMQLRGARGAQAREYLRRRGLDEAAIERFGIGFAPDDRGALLAHLTNKGVSQELIVESGMAIRPDDGSAPYDRFRGRVMFPIRDARGRCIAFGGRALREDARAKYLNSPDTPLFDKGSTLYNIGPAREAAGRAGRLLVAEGYMDVIALVLAGFEAAVAPLGTAVTERQLRLMWRLADEPVIMLDGDAAGLRAARRLVDLALPLLEPGKTLRFCLLPEGKDPDDFLRDSGPEALERLIAEALPLVEMLWRREIEGRVFDAPERRAALDKRLSEALARIPDRGLRGHYADALRERRDALFGRPARRSRAPEDDPPPAAEPREDWGRAPGGRRGGFGARRGGWKDAARREAGPSAQLRASQLASRAGASPARWREAALLLGVLNHPPLAETFEAELDVLRFETPEFEAVRDAILAELGPALEAPEAEAPDILRAGVARRLGRDPHALLAQGVAPLTPALARGAPRARAEAVLREALAIHLARQAQAAEIEAARRDLGAEGAFDLLMRRLAQAAQERERAARPAPGAEALGDENEEALRAQLRALHESRIWARKRRKNRPDGA